MWSTYKGSMIINYSYRVVILNIFKSGMTLVIYDCSRAFIRLTTVFKKILEKKLWDPIVFVLANCLLTSIVLFH